MMLHDPWWLFILFLYYSMLRTLPVLLFLCTYKRIQLLWLHRGDCNSAGVVWSTDAFNIFFFNVVCTNRAVLLSQIHWFFFAPRGPLGRKKNTNTQAFSPFFKSLLRKSCDLAKTIQLCFLTTTTAQRKPNEKMIEKERKHTQTYKSG